MTDLGYFKIVIRNLVGAAIFLDYLVNLVTFHILVEIALQPILFLIIVAPIVSKGAREQRKWRRVKNWSLGILGTVMLGLAIWTLVSKLDSIDLLSFMIKVAWPFFLGIWILPLVFVLAIISSYEQSFLELEMSHPKPTDLWKSKFGLVLALRLRLKWINKAANGGTFHVARAES